MLLFITQLLLDAFYQHLQNCQLSTCTIDFYAWAIRQRRQPLVVTFYWDFSLFERNCLANLVLCGIFAKVHVEDIKIICGITNPQAINPISCLHVVSFRNLRSCSSSTLTKHHPHHSTPLQSLNNFFINHTPPSFFLLHVPFSHATAHEPSP